MRKQLDSDLAVTCPLCHAPAGTGCVSTGGHGRLGGLVHRERRRASVDGVLDALRAKLSGEVDSGV